MRRGAKKAGYGTERWTLRRVAELIRRHFGVHYHPNYLAVPLRKMGLMAQHQKGAARTGAAIALVDETGHSFRSAPATTWAPRGHPPVLNRVSGRREVSSIVALVVMPGRKQVRLYARHFLGYVRGPQVAATLRYLSRKVGRPLVVVWDGLKAHRSADVLRLLKDHPDLFRLELLPPYAPDLNPGFALVPPRQ